MSRTALLLATLSLSGFGAALLAATACSEDPPPAGGDAATVLPPLDAALDGSAAGSGADAGGEPDSGTAGTADDAGAKPPDGGTSGPPDATVFSADGSVTGTVLENVAVEWPGPLELCNGWVENNAIAEELARKVKVSLPAQQRAGLQPWQLAQASVDGILVERSNLSSARWRPAPGTIGLSLRRYQVSQVGSTTLLEAELAHHLGPAAGTLVERYRLSRAASADPVVVDGAWASECSFAMEMPGVADPVLLERCAGQAGLEDAVQLLRATRGASTAVLARFLKTRSADAGSAPVYVTGVQLSFTDNPWLLAESGDFFAFTYAARHHNFDEGSLADFAQDPLMFHQVFRPIAEGAGTTWAVPEKVALQHVNAFGAAPTLTITMRNPDNTTATEIWQVQHEGHWIRVDETELLRAAGTQHCATPEVFFVGAGTAAIGMYPSFQLVTCPQAAAPGYSLAALVPVWLPQEPSAIGTTLSGAAISPTSGPGGSGHVVSVGAHSVTLLTADRQQFLVEVKDSAGVSVSRYVGLSYEMGQFPQAQQTIAASNEAAGVSMTFVRQFAGQGGGNSTLYIPLSFSLTFGGQTRLVDGMDQLRYTNTHHNDSDTLEARADGLVMTWRRAFTTSFVHQVEVKTEAGDTVLAPTILE